MDGTEDRAARIFGNDISPRAYRKACRAQARSIRSFGDDSSTPHHLSAEALPVIGERLGVRTLCPAASAAPAFDLTADAVQASGNPDAKPLVVGTIRMGFGHYRIAMAMASAAHALGYAPYWFNLCGFPDSTCSKLIMHQNDLYSTGSRLSQKWSLFNRLVWEPMNSEGFRKLTYNASDQKSAELMAPVFEELPRDVPFIGTHAWTAQAAIHADMTHVVNAIPDNWPMALHLAEGSIHTVQTPSSYLGYRELRGMDPHRTLKPMPAGSIFYTGHYVDHELVENIEADCTARRARLESGQPIRYLLSVGGAGAQQDLFARIIEHLAPLVASGHAALCINVGDHRDVWDALAARIPALSDATCHFDGFETCARFADEALTGPLEGVHAFCDSDIFAAVYSTNLLMRACDVLITKPSELAFYPVPKMMIHRVGGHEAWGAIRAAEVGDGTYELETPDEIGAMIDAFDQDRSLVADMCDHIEAANLIGTYNGAYKAVELAAGGCASF